MKFPSKDDGADPADREAAKWLIKRDHGLTAAEQDEFFQWLAADPRHGEALARLQRTWREFDHLAQWRPEHSVEPNPDLLAKDPVPPAAGMAGRCLGLVVRWPFWAAIAACVALAVGGSYFVSRSALPATPVTMIAETYGSHILEDGSVVELNRDARIEVTYLPNERRVRLIRGEASFQVEKNHDRPFIVRAGGVDVRAVGTAFNVRIDEKSVEVLVTEGKVSVNDAARGDSLLAPTTPGETPLLVAGKKITIEVAPIAVTTATTVSSAEVERMLWWRPIMLEFNSRPLSEVVTEFNLRNRIQLRLMEDAPASLPIVATFRSDNVDGFVRLLELTAGVRAEREGETIRLRSAK